MTAVGKLAERFVENWDGYKEDAVAVVCGAVGDRLAAAGSRLAIPMSLLRPREVGTHACVFVHGLMGTPRAWVVGEVDYGAELQTRVGVTPVFAHYNSGRHISTNGRELAAELDALAREWPDLSEITVIGHSMGGLVARSACHYGLEAGQGWVEQVRRMIMLGVPSRGAPLEQLAHVAAFTLETIWNPWTKLVGKAINLRSDGIKDLRHGFVLDEDWRHIDVDQLRLAAPRRSREAPNAKWFVAAGALSSEGLWRVLGDGMVHRGSARGEGLGSAPSVLPPAVVKTFPGTHHVQLMTDPAVLEAIVRFF